MKVEIYDRIAVGDQLMMFRWPNHEEDLNPPMTADDAVEEYQVAYYYYYYYYYYYFRRD